MARIIFIRKIFW